MSHNKKKRIAKALGVSTLAAATLASGLSFGTIAATAATEPVNPPDSGVFVPMYGIKKAGGSSPYSAMSAIADGRVRPVSALNPTEAQSLAVRATALTVGAPQMIRLESGKCLANDNNYLIVNVRDCDTNAAWQRWVLQEDGTIQAYGGSYVLSSTAKSSPQGQILGSELVSPTSSNVVYFSDSFRAGVYGAVDSVDVAGQKAQISGRGTPGAQVQIGNSTVVTVADDGTWSATVSKLKLGKNTVTLAEYKDGESEPSSTFDLEIDLAIEQLTGVVSITSNVDDLAKVSGKAQSGAEVRAFDESGKQIASATASAENTYSMEIPAPNKGGDYQVTVAQFLDNERNGDLDLTVKYGAAVQVTSPEDGAEHDGGTLDITGTGASGARVTVSEGRTALGEATVMPNGNWSVEDVDLSNGEHELTVTQKSKGANTTTRMVTVNPGEGQVELTAAGRFDDEDATKPATAFGAAPSGATVVLRNSVGTEIGRTVAKDNAYEITIDPAKVTTGPNTFSVVIAGAESESKSFMLNYGVPAADVVVTKPAKNGTVTPGRVEFAGTGQAGSKVVVRGSSREVASATVNGQGSWSATSAVELGAGSYDLYFDQIGKGGISKTIRHAFTIGETAPIVTPHTVTSPAAGAVVETLTPEFRGTGHEGATITVRGSSRVIATGTVVNGQWVAKTDAASPLAPGAYNLYVDQSIRGTVSSTIRVSFTVSNESFRELTLSAPAQGENVTVLRPTFVGTATPGAQIRVGSSRTTVATATVGQDGTWRATADFDLAKGGTYAGLEVKQTTTSGKTSTVSSTFTIDRNAQ